MHVKGKGWDVADWIRLDQKRDEWWALVNTVMNLQIPQNKGNFWTNGELSASRKGLCARRLVCQYTRKRERTRVKNRDWKWRTIKERKFKRGEEIIKYASHGH